MVRHPLISLLVHPVYHGTRGEQRASDAVTCRHQSNCHLVVCLEIDRDSNEVHLRSHIKAHVLK